MNRKRFASFFLGLAALLIIPSCAVNPVTGKKQLMLMSEAQEIAMGKQYDPQVMATFGEYPEEELLRFIEAKGREMARISHRPNLEYHFRILDTPVINAFAVPGGYIYFTRGILAQFSSEAELIGVLGHEMGHITARHTVSQQSKQQLGQLLLIGGMIASEKFRDFAGYALQGMQLLFLKFSRDNERQSDRLGVEYASRIGYDAGEMARFFNVLDRMQMKSGHAGVPTFMSTHPDPGNRQQTVGQLASHWKDSLGYSDYQVNRDNYLEMIDGMVYGEDPRQGYVEGNVFYHPEMQFQFPVPSSWKLENSPLQVQLAPDDGSAMMVFTQAQQKTLPDAVEENLKALNLTLLSSRETTVNGMPAYAAVSEQVSQNQQTGGQQTLKVLSYFIDFKDKIFVFHGVASEEDFNSRFRNFESTMINFNRLTDPSKRNVSPKRIKIVRTRETAELADIFASQGILKNQMEELALLNNRELTDRIPAGTKIKIVTD